jgi:hypothetical protein
MKKVKPKNIVIAVPAYTGQICVGTHRSILYDTIGLINEGHQVRVVDETGNADIYRCRAMIVAKFLAQRSATHLVMIDADVCWEQGGLSKLVNAGVDFVAGAYPQRIGEGTKFHMRLLDRPAQALDPETGLLEVEAMPAGFVCLSRSMLERMIGVYTSLKFSFEQCPGGVAWDLFDGFWEADETGLRHKSGEDYSFCRRWRDIGGKVWCDPHISMGHAGMKLWQGRFADGFRPVEDKAA